MNRIIWFLIRLKLGVGKWQLFRFTNQKEDSVYYFDDTQLRKIFAGRDTLSKVSVNWILSKECEVEICQA